MKKLLIVLLIASAAVFAFIKRDIKVPSAAKQSFAKTHPGIDGEWGKEGANYEVNFKDADKTMSCVIEANGIILETETDIAINQLPEAASIFIKGHYKDATIKDASQIVRNNGEVNFEAEINDKDVLFDKDGKFIKEVND